MYVQTTHSKGIEGVARTLARMLDAQIDLGGPGRMGAEFEKNTGEAIRKYPDLARQVRKLEEKYATELIGQKEGLEGWPKQQGIGKV